MAEGKDKIASSLMDLQPTAILEFFVIYPDLVNHPTIEIRIHAGSIYTDSLTWQGKTYIPVSVEVEGFEQSATGQLARPKIRIANKDYLITGLLHKYNDFQFAKIIRKRTFVKYLDEVNFEGGNPYGDADSTAELSNEEYVIGQKTQESKVSVEFELASPLDLETFEINNRRIMGKYCYWTYRGCGCNYQGVPLQQENGKPFTDVDGVYVVPNISDFDSINNDTSFLWEMTQDYSRGDVAYIENDKVLINPYGAAGKPEPMKIWYVAVSGSLGSAPDSNPSFWQKDGCNKKLSSCRLRFNDTEQIAYQTNYTTEVTGQLIDFSGQHGSGILTNVDEDLLEIPRANNFTLGFWYKGGASADRSAYLSTQKSIGYRFEADSDGLMHLVYIKTNEFEGVTYKGLSHSTSHLTLMLLEVNRDDNELSLYSSNNLSNPIHNNTTDGDQQFSIYFDQITFGLSLQTSQPAVYPTPTPNFKLGPAMLWSGVLTHDERHSLVLGHNEGNDTSLHQPLKYERATGNAASLTGGRDKLKLIYWLEETGFVDGGTDVGFLDSSPNGHDFTGHGYGFSNFSYSVPETVTRYRKGESTAILPFGGFPGTDGFSYGS